MARHIGAQDTKSTLTFQQDQQGTAPCAVSRQTTTVAHGEVIYVPTSEYQILSYNTKSQKWIPLPPCPIDVNHGGLALLQDLLTVVGGRENRINITKRLISFNKEKQKWAETYPRMPTAHCCPTAVSYRNHLIVIGGGTRRSVISTVEVLNADSMVWSTAASLPFAYNCASATICGDQLYMLGGNEHESRSRPGHESSSLSVLTCDLPELLRSCDKPSLVSSLKRKLGLGSTNSTQVWERATDIPVYYSACASVRGELVAVGGCDKSRNPTTAVHQYNTATKEWRIIGHMSIPRFDCHVAVVQDKELYVHVIGGCISALFKTNLIERAIVT